MAEEQRITQYVDPALAYHREISDMFVREVTELEAQYPFQVHYQIGYAYRYIKPQAIIKLVLDGEAFLVTYASFVESSAEEAMELLYLALHGMVDKYLILKDVKLCLKDS